MNFYLCVVVFCAKNGCFQIGWIAPRMKFHELRISINLLIMCIMGCFPFCFCYHTHYLVNCLNLDHFVLFWMFFFLIENINSSMLLMNYWNGVFSRFPIQTWCGAFHSTYSISLLNLAKKSLKFSKHHDTFQLDGMNTA